MSTSATLTMLNCLTLWITTKYGKFFKKMGITDHLTCLLQNMNAGPDVTESYMEQQTASKLEKEYIKAVYCHPTYLTSVQSTSCERPGWMKQNLESRLPGEISINPDMQMTPPLWQKEKRT